MRVLIANSHISWGGLGQYTINLAKALKERDCEVIGLLTHDKSERANEFISILDEFYYTGSFPKLRRYFETARIINKAKPDILVINYLGTVHFLLPFLRRTTVVSVIHSDQKDFYRIASIFAGQVNAWIAPTLRVKEGFSDYTRGKYNDKIVVITHGINVDTDPDDVTVPSNDKLRLVFVGSLYRHKGVDLIPSILKKLKMKNVHAELSILGGGDLSDWLKSEFNNEITNGTVKIRGVVSQSEVKRELENSDVLLFPTRVEAFGLVIIEAMAQGVVPVVSNLKGITDTIVDDQETGFLVDKDDIDGFVDKIEFLYLDRAKLIEIKKAASISVKNRFSLDIMGKRYRELFDEMLNCRKEL